MPPHPTAPTTALQMTGLDVEKDAVLQIAVVCTGGRQRLCEGAAAGVLPAHAVRPPPAAIHPTAATLLIPPWCRRCARADCGGARVHDTPAGGGAAGEGGTRLSCSWWWAGGRVPLLPTAGSAPGRVFSTQNQRSKPARRAMQAASLPCSALPPAPHAGHERVVRGAARQVWPDAGLPRLHDLSGGGGAGGAGVCAAAGPR